mmetsp:Transcript_3751/g.4164  ORF Transcript_3751/g.4164 Transcript_3751/m.4164 type:complete len:82 (+) Transcript_3751:1825-2070(+)
MVTRDSTFIRLNGGGGGDHIQAERFTAQSSINGGGGSDCIATVDGNQAINGGNGADTCVSNSAIPNNCEVFGGPTACVING